MKKHLPLIIAILLLALAYFTGCSKYIGLAWYGKATLIGGAGGIILALAAYWFNKNSLNITLIALFAITAAITYYYARIFIDSADFEPTAGFVWYIGYHIGAALFIPTAAYVLQKILPQSASTD
ncbi:MAG: hypothetical protein COB24_09630 [Hyphomicrobiales bacterium]|nr:MAG: hypothetical protein COB24_09630 [Hyphomicrobiales bacterium]